MENEKPEIQASPVQELPKEEEVPQIYPHVILKVLETNYITHDVKRFVLEKPPGYSFIPGQSVNVSINLPEWKNELRPFTFTGIPDDNYLEFMIKIYRNHNGVTKKLESINEGDELILHDVFGEIQYRENGVFIAAGSGITPFLSIFRYLYRQRRVRENLLIYSNKTSEDVIMEESLHTMLKDNFITIFTREHVVGFAEKRIDRDFLIDHIGNFKQHFYICGPESFVKDLREILQNLGATVDHIIFED
ncbi:MAG: FAD-binding oxidoreductase [Bacteroidia bacterium]